MHLDVTEAALEGIDLDPATHLMMRENLCGQIIQYDSDFDITPFRQRNGQLMGSVFSFPFLCCANLAVVRKAFELRFRRDFHIHELPVLVNGDDILFPSDNELVRIWESLIPEVGFQKSVGKNFVSDRFAFINSVMFWFKGQTVGQNPVKIPYLNHSFLYGIKKGSESDDDREETYNDALWALRGAFRDWQGDEFPEEARKKFSEAILLREDVRHSHLCQNDLGLTEELPVEECELRSFLFKKRVERCCEKGRRLNRPGFGYGLERKVEAPVAPILSNVWKSVWRKKFCPTAFQARILDFETKFAKGRRAFKERHLRRSFVKYREGQSSTTPVEDEGWLRYMIKYTGFPPPIPAVTRSREQIDHDEWCKRFDALVLPDVKVSQNECLGTGGNSLSQIRCFLRTPPMP